MKKLLLAGAFGAAAIASTPASAAVYTLGTFAVPPTRVVNITPDTHTTAGVFQDEFRFSVTSAITLTASGFNTTAIPNFSNLDFGSVELRSGFGSSGALLGSYVNGGSINGFETSDLQTKALAAGDYTIVVNGNVLKGPARFDGNIVFAAVPEPATWAMMLAGFGLIGGVARRSNRVRAVLA